MTATTDPATLLGDLRAELVAGRALIGLTAEPGPTKRAAYAALSLAVDLVADAADLFAHPAAGPRDPLLRERLAAEAAIDGFGLADDGLPTGLSVEQHRAGGPSC